MHLAGRSRWTQTHSLAQTKVSAAVPGLHLHPRYQRCAEAPSQSDKKMDTLLLSVRDLGQSSAGTRTIQGRDIPRTSTGKSGTKMALMTVVHGYLQSSCTVRATQAGRLVGMATAEHPSGNFGTETFPVVPADVQVARRSCWFPGMFCGRKTEPTGKRAEPGGVQHVPSPFCTSDGG